MSDKKLGPAGLPGKPDSNTGDVANRVSATTSGLDNGIHHGTPSPVDAAHNHGDFGHAGDGPHKVDHTPPHDGKQGPTRNAGN